MEPPAGRCFRAALAGALLLGLLPSKAATDDPAPPAGGVLTLRVLLGVKDAEPTPWTGSWRLSAGRVIATDGWRSAGDDTVSRDGQFSLQTRRAYPILWQQRAKDAPPPPVEPNGFVLTLAGLTPDSVLELETNQGAASVPLAAYGYGGPRRLLEGRIEVLRLPNYRVVVNDPSEDAMPAIAGGPDGTLNVVYVQFTHGEKFRKREPVPTMPADFADLGQPTGGDRVLFLECRDGQWSTPVALSPAGGDVWRPCVAVDGQGRVWAFWSGRSEDNWDLFAAVRTGTAWSAPRRLTTDPGPDLEPAAATDSQGRIWLAWQAFRNGQSDILVATQAGDGFTAGEVVGGGPANEWSPAIAAGPDGRVAVAWDSHAQGDYDVLMRSHEGAAWAAPRRVAASPDNEARPTACYDGKGRLWLAYEISPAGWGKDFGPYDRSPLRVALGQVRELGVRVWDGSRFLMPAAALTTALPNPEGGTRGPKATGKTLVANPRLAADREGRVFLAVRNRLGRFTSNTGTCWMTFLTSLDGNGWRPPVVVPATDGLMHEVSALCAVPAGGIALVSSSDGRFGNAAFFGPPQEKRRVRRAGAPPPCSRERAVHVDPAGNADLAVAFTGSLAAPDEMALTPVPEEAGHDPAPEMAAEARHIAAVRAYRTTVGGREARILRGEFHRHTEISADGGGDGSLLDMWRYGLDLAALDWIGNGDHDNGAGREYSWWLTQKTTDLFRVPGAFTPMFTYERSCNYPDGHRNVVFARRGVRTLPRLKGGAGTAMDQLPPEADRPNSPDTQMLYAYLRAFDGVCASHTSGTDMGTDWRDNDPRVEPVVEIYQGDRQNYERPDAPRANSAEHSIGGWRPLGFVSRALLKGYRLGFQSSSDHVSTHMSYCCVLVENASREAILDALKRRHVYGATDNIIADVRCGPHVMGDEFAVKEPPTLHVKLVGTAPFDRVVIVKDDAYVYSTTPKTETVEFSWTDTAVKPGVTSYYYVRGEQAGEEVEIKVAPANGTAGSVKASNGELVWVSPLWITYAP